MQMTGNASKSRFLSKKTIRTVILFAAGMVIISGITALLMTNVCLSESEKLIDSVMDYVSDQCARNDNDLVVFDVRSKMSLVEKTTEISREIDYHGDLPSETRIESYLGDFRINGVILLDSELNPVEFVNDGNDEYEPWRTYTEKESIRELTLYPQKVYINNAVVSGEKYIYAAVASSDGKYIVFSYVREESSITGYSENGIENMLVRYNPGSDGIVALTDGQKVISTNYPSMDGKDIDECSCISILNNSPNPEKMSETVMDGKAYFGRIEKCRDYYIYVFLPKDKMFADRRGMLIFVGCFYVFLWFVYFMLNTLNQKKRFTELEREHNINAAIGSVYSTYYLVDLETQRVDILKGSNEIKGSFEGRNAQDVIYSLIDEYIPDEFREEARSFSDFSTIQERIGSKPYITSTYCDVFGRWYIAGLIPKRTDKNGKITAVIYTLRNITDQKTHEMEMQQNLLRSNKTLKETVDILESLSNVYFTSFYVDLTENHYKCIFIAPWLENMVPHEGKYTELVETLVNGTVIDEFKDEVRIFTSIDYARNSLSKETVTDVRKSYYSDYRSLRNGEKKWCRVTMIVVDFDDDGKARHVLAVLQDIGEQKEKEIAFQNKILEAAQEARQANVAKTEFLRRMSHDIRTPINGILGMLDIADRCSDDPEKQRECRDKIRSASMFLFDLVNDVLDMSKMESGKITIEAVPFNAYDMLNEIKSLIEVQAVERGISVKTDFDGLTHRNLIGSPVHLRQILINIAGNAVKYNRQDGTILITARELESHGSSTAVEFTCADTGIGMSKEFQERMFEPFTQEEDGARTTFIGTGLGLSIVKKLVDKMDGTINVESEKGKGSLFKVTLPFEIDSNAETQPLSVEEDDEKCSIDGVKILLVEDNEINMEIARFSLEKEGAAITSAWNGQEAIDIFSKSAEGDFDVILMDIMMPVMDGITAAKAIRKLNRSDAAAIPIIAMTANAFSDDVERSLEAGMNAHLSKPLDVGKIVKVVSKLIKNGGVIR